MVRKYTPANFVIENQKREFDSKESVGGATLFPTTLFVGYIYYIV